MPISAFTELHRSMQKNIQKCPWTKEQTLESVKEELLSEAQEIISAIEKKDYENLKEELGDLLWDTLFLAGIAEKEGKFTLKEVLETVNAKIKRRKSWLFENKSITKEEAMRIWEAVKKEEKREKGR